MRKACAMMHGLEEKRAFCINFIEDRVLSNVIYAMIKSSLFFLISKYILRPKVDNYFITSNLLKLLHKLNFLNLGILTICF